MRLFLVLVFAVVCRGMDLVNLILELDSTEDQRSFETRYGQLLAGEHKCYDIGHVKLCHGAFNINFVKSAFFDKAVKRISLDRPVQISGVEEFAPKHLVRISQLGNVNRRQLMDYTYEPAAGANVSAYVVDTGIKLDHPDLNSRARLGANLVKDGTYGDPNGHGTALAGLVGSEMFGVSKKCTLVDYRVLDETGVGKLSSVLEAIKMIHDNEVPGVVLLAMVTERNEIFHSALSQLVERGFAVVSAAGNFHGNACDYSPAAFEHGLTIGSIEPYSDNLTFFTNWGPCVDVFGDGVGVATLSPGPDLVTRKSGTSMSAAIAAGLLATYMSMNDTCSEAMLKVRNLAEVGSIAASSISQFPETPNRILNNYGGKLGQILNS
ncbi:hypothetical protein OGAPHI_000908 [Ogataea philodendri]|uniref:Peptidase S8/S53 domain-containing protein n=1 Tax=Ogataea philodendri TaxID=1378263 RepID=A0A9P8PDR7_9ASCO|nr:uncharacterized protein OGAPHI_000908 [Ogataea philodendri]KAH3670393.1 hypothetical protein OGAPHI_000908 [Ogataea philodendri]